MKNKKTRKDDIIVALYDGKWGRACVGKIVEARGFCIKVQFKDYWDNKKSEMYAIRNYQIKKIIAHRGYLRSKDSMMQALFDEPGDFYVILPFKQFIREAKAYMDKKYINKLEKTARTI